MKKLFITIAFLLFTVPVPLSAQIYTYPGWGCSCYGPSFNMEECAGALGLGIRVQIIQPTTDGKCGREGGREFPDRLFGVSIRHCCAEHDLDYGTCNLPKDYADQKLESCGLAACGDNRLCQIGTAAYHIAVVAGGGGAYRDTQQSLCMCSPCGLTGMDCFFDVGPGPYPPEPKEPRPNIPPWFPWPFPGGGSSMLDMDTTHFQILKAGTCPVPFWPVEEEI